MNGSKAKILNIVKKTAKYGEIPVKGFKVFKDLAFVAGKIPKEKNKGIKPIKREKKKTYSNPAKSSKNIIYALKSSMLTFSKLFRLFAAVLDRL
ncbi:MAG: hypothetical protein VB120_07195 [Lachnospiraceae bacterium]|nr:hypothetical protein [Lachnospiraceae bacterium]